jgi:hypothetical protein
MTAAALLILLIGIIALINHRRAAHQPRTIRFDQVRTWKP